jgi:nucleotide-binding universal stress UspA family protein
MGYAPEHKSKPIRHILIALDLDPSAKKVAEAGYRIAKEINAEVCLLHIVSENIIYTSPDLAPVSIFGGFSNADFTVMADTQGVIKASEYFLHKIREHLGSDENIITLIREGSIAEMIIRTAIEKDSDLVVMGSHSKRWLEHVLIGSVTEKVLHNSTIPLLIIPVRKA